MRENDKFQHSSAVLLQKERPRGWVSLRANLGMLAKDNFHALGYRNKYNADQSNHMVGLPLWLSSPSWRHVGCAVAQVVRSIAFNHKDLDSIQSQSMWICDGQSGMGTDLFPSTSVFPSQDLSTSAPDVFIIYCQHYIILAIDNIIKKHKVKLVLLGIFQEIECCEWGVM